MDYLKYKEEKIPVRISFKTLKRFQKESGKDLTEIDSNSLDMIELMAFHAYKVGCETENEKVKYKLEDFEDILDVDGNFSNFLTIVSESMVKIMGSKKRGTKRIYP